MPGRKMPVEADRGAREPMRRQFDHGAQIGGESEQRTGDRLRGAVAGEKGIVADPARVTKALRSKGSTTWPPPNTKAPER